MRTRNTLKAGVAVIAAFMFLGTLSADGQEAADSVLKLTLTNKLPYPIDVFTVDENEDPPTEVYEATLASPKKTKVLGKDTVTDSPKTLETYAGIRWRLKVQKPPKPGDTAKPKDPPRRATKAEDLLPLYDYVVTEQADQKHDITNDAFLLGRLGQGTEVVLVGERGVLLADDHPTADFGPALNRTGAHLRQRESSLLDVDSKHRNYRWIISPPNNGKAGAYSLLLKLDGEESRVFLVSAPDELTCPGFVCAVAPSPKDSVGEEGTKQVQEFNERTSFFIRPDKNNSPLGTPIRLNRSDERNYDESFTETIETDKGKTVITFDAASLTEETVFTGKNGEFKRDRRQVPLIYKFNRFVAIPWGDSKSAGSLETLALLGIKNDSADSWQKFDALNLPPVKGKVAAAKAEIPAQRAQISSATPYCRAGYHQVRLNPLNLAENGLEGRQGNPIFAARSDLTAGNFYSEGDYRVPIDFYLRTEGGFKNIDKTLMYDIDTELTDTAASTLGFDFSGTMTATGTANFLVGSASLATQTNFSFGYGSSFGQTLSTQTSEQKTTVVKTKYGSKFYLMLNKQDAVLDENFRQALLALADATSTDAFDKFFNTYGTHYSIASLMGGRASKYGTIDNKSTRSYTKTDGGYNWSAGVNLIAKGSNDTSKAASKSRVDEVQEWKEFGVGGSGTSYEQFDVREVIDLIPIKVYLRPIWQLVTPELLFEKPITQADSALASALQSVVMKEWFRHLSPEATGAPRKRAEDSGPAEDPIGVIVDDFKFSTPFPKELPTHRVSGALRGEALLLNDLSPLKEQSRQATLPARYIRDRKDLVGNNSKQFQMMYAVSPEGEAKVRDDLRPTPLRAMFMLPRTSATPKLGAIAVRLSIDFQGGACVGGKYKADASFEELRELTYMEARSNSAWMFLQQYDRMHLEPSEQTRLIGGSASYPGGFVDPLPEERGVNFTFISSPIERLVQGRKAATDYWPGMDAANASLTWSVVSETMKEFDEMIGRRKSTRLIPIIMNYRVQVGLLSDGAVREKPVNPHLDDELPKVAALEPTTKP